MITFKNLQDAPTLDDFLTRVQQEEKGSNRHEASIYDRISLNVDSEKKRLITSSRKDCPAATFCPSDADTIVNRPKRRSMRHAVHML